MYVLKINLAVKKDNSKNPDVDIKIDWKCRLIAGGNRS